jgi:hypothetical protein
LLIIIFSFISSILAIIFYLKSWKENNFKKCLALVADTCLANSKWWLALSPYCKTTLLWRAKKYDNAFESAW